jgi:septum formation protein
VRPLSDDAIEGYLDTGRWQGKAGAYGIQDKADPFVENLEGSFTNVVGMPMELIADLFSEWES